MRRATLLSLAMAAVLMPAPAALAQTAAGYAIQTSQSVNSGAHFPAIQPPSNYGDNNPRSIAIPSTATASVHRTRREKVVDDSNHSDNDQSSPTDNWVQVK